MPGGSDQIALITRFMAKGNSVCAICLAWPEKEILVRALANKVLSDNHIATISMLGPIDVIKRRRTDDGLALSVPREKPGSHAIVYRIDLKRI